MEISLYSNGVAEFLTTLNDQFCLQLGLKNPFKYEDILPGERYGIIAPRSIGPDSDRSPAHTNVRTGYQFQAIDLEILIVLGCERGAAEGRVESQIAGLKMILGLQTVIPSLKANLPNNLIYDLQQVGESSIVLRQSTRPPHTWTVDVTSSAVAKLTTKRNAQGEHAQPNWTV
jgi:hypothetical protein